MAKRISQSSVNWTAMTERVTAEQRNNFMSFKSKSEGYLRRVLANPAEPPKIDWAKYKKVVPVPGMVDKFQKEYEALKIPYPQDTLTSQVEAQWAELKKALEKFISESNSTIAQYEKEIATTKASIPYDQMTMEDYRDAHPDQALDPINKPTFWPHDEAEDIKNNPKERIEH